MKGRTEARPRGLLVFLLDDPWRKLASLALAVAVWLWLSARTDERWTVDLPLSPESAEGQRAPLNKIGLSVPRDQLLIIGFFMPGQDSQPVEKVQVTVFGQKKDVDFVRRRGVGFVVDPLDHERTSGRVDITASRLTLDYGDAVKLTFEMSPPRIEAHLARIAQRLVSLDTAMVRHKLPDREDQRARVLWQDAQFSPGQVTLVGPRNEIDSLPKGPLFRVDLAKDDLDKLPLDQTMLVARLTLLPEIADRKLRILETTAEVRVRLARRSTVFTLEVVPELDFPDGTPPQERALVQPQDKKAKVQLRSYSPALTEILSKSPAEVDEWIHKNCRLRGNMAAYDKAAPRIPTVFYIYKDGQEFLAGTDFDVVLDPVFVEPAR